MNSRICADLNKKIKVGTLVLQKIDNKEDHDIGIVINIKKTVKPATKFTNEEVKIFWFSHRVSFCYSLVDIEWFLMGQEEALWRIFN